MVETLTTNYGWTKPEVAHSPSTWGGFLNADLDSIDALVFANQQGIVPIGAITMFAGYYAPANWLFCDGSSISTAAPYDKLFTILGYNYGGGGINFNLPNLQSRFPIGAGPGYGLTLAGGAATVTLDQSMIPAHSHVVEQTPHTHSASSPAHSHSINDLSHSHSVNAVFGGGSEIQGGSGWGQHNISSGGNVTGINTTNSAAPSVSIAAANANINPATDNTGGGLAHNNVPPFLALNFIIRFQ